MWPRRTANRQLNRVNQLALSTNRAGATAASTFGPTIRHPEPTWAMRDDGIPAHKFGRRFGDKSSGPNLTLRFAWGFPEGLACASLGDARANEHPIQPT